MAEIKIQHPPVKRSAPERHAFVGADGTREILVKTPWNGGSLRYMAKPTADGWQVIRPFAEPTMISFDDGHWQGNFGEDWLAAIADAIKRAWPEQF